MSIYGADGKTPALTLGIHGWNADTTTMGAACCAMCDAPLLFRIIYFSHDIDDDGREARNSRTVMTLIIMVDGSN